ncbi:MAG: hypothetical protein JW919_01145 [Candidatus Omnitrophica bacterium]|nr:hypothetical protein [Candidatus Omnitrophota bacterium]
MSRALSITLLVAAVVLSSVACLYAANEAQQQTKLVPKKVSIDSNYDGKVETSEYYNEKGEIVRAETYSPKDGLVEQVLFYEKGRPVRCEQDTNRDGKTDIWIEY